MVPGRDETATIVDHGGSLDRARALFPDAPEPWIDLSTGINPHSYPVFDLPATAFTRLPEPGSNRLLARAAAISYGAPSAAHVVPAPGTQILLPRVASLVKPGRAVVLGPTYAEHRRAAAIAGHRVEETDDLDRLADADLAILVNPNNPDGRVVQRARLAELAAALRRRGGLLVVDEAFMDVGPRGENLDGDVDQGGIVVLRSLGKFFGLAGVRLGFAIASTELAARLDDQLGPWAVAGPALEIGMRALADKHWQETTRAMLAEAANRLDALLARHDIRLMGGTSLFRYARLPDAGSLFETLGRHGILVRNFDARPQHLRFGLPANESDWDRFARALGVWKDGRKTTQESTKP
jgi:cobalamin biosynthetic protein CobC